MAKAEVSFSDRTKPRVDPHQWALRQGELRVGRRLIQRIAVWICERCDKATTLRPEHIHDLPACKEKSQ